MADIELRKRLAAAVGVSLNDHVLDSIYQALMEMEKGKIPVTMKFEFSVDADGALSVEFSSKVALPIQKFTMALHSDGKQLTLGLPGQATIQAPKPKPAEPPSPFEPFYPPTDVTVSPRVAARLATLKAEAEEHYRAGRISKAQAMAAGVEVESDRDPDRVS